MVNWISFYDFNCHSFVNVLQVGVELVFRVLGCKSKRITVTHKKTLVCFLLTLISSSYIFISSLVYAMPLFWLNLLVTFLELEVDISHIWI